MKQCYALIFHRIKNLLIIMEKSEKKNFRVNIVFYKMLILLKYS